MLVSLTLFGLLIIIASGFLVPLKLTRQSGSESQGTNLARAYIEIVKARWQTQAAYTQTDYALPKVSETDTKADIKLPKGWLLEINSTSWAVTDTIRTLTVTVKPAGSTTKDYIILSARINKPS
jgi:hypothetical protein